MQPSIHLNWLAILVSVVASFLLGGLFFINAGFQFVSLQILGMVLTFWAVSRR